MGDERLKMSGISSGFPAVGHPGFGLYTSSSGHPECGDAGSFGFSALAAHSQLGPFSGRSSVLLCFSENHKRRLSCMHAFNFHRVLICDKSQQEKCFFYCLVMGNYY